MEYITKLLNERLCEEYFDNKGVKFLRIENEVFIFQAMVVVGVEELTARRALPNVYKRINTYLTMNTMVRVFFSKNPEDRVRGENTCSDKVLVDYFVGREENVKLDFFNVSSCE